MGDQKKYERVKVELSEREILRRSRDLTDAMDNHKRLEHEMKVQAAQFRQELKENQARIDELSSVVQTGREYQQVEVNEVYDWAKGTVEVFRFDTGERLFERAIGDDERQTEMGG